MKKLIFIILLFVAGFAQAQETTVELVEIISQDIDTLICDRGRVITTIDTTGGLPGSYINIAVSDTLTSAYFRVTKTTIENSTSIPSVRLDTLIMEQNGCPTDSAEVARILKRDVVEYSNRVSDILDRSFKFIRGDRAEWVQNRAVFESFTNSSVNEEIEESYYSTWSGQYVIIDLESGTSTRATLVRVGATNRYRLQVNDSPNTRYAFIPRNNGKHFIFRGADNVNRDMILDSSSTPKRPVYREIGYLDGTDKYRIVKIN